MKYTKTAVSLPQDVFEGCEQVAAELGISRSELYARALREMLRTRKTVAARARLDAALASDGADGTRQAQDMHGVASATIHHAAGRGESSW
jgi:hypothetical protein